MPRRFGPEARVRGRKEFRRAFFEGRKLVGRRAILWTCDNGAPDKGSRLGLSVSAKVGGAVLRNRLKRLAREAFRLNRSRLASGRDLIVYLRPGCRWSGLAEAEADLMELWRKAGLLPA